MEVSNPGNSRFSATFMRRHPITGPIARFLYRGILLVLGTGLGVTGLLCFTTGSPLQAYDGLTWMILLVIALMFSPYLAMSVLAFLYIGSGAWRGLAILLGSLIMTGYGLINVLNYWYFAPRPVAIELLAAFPLKQWLVMAVTIALAFIPGILFFKGIEKLVDSKAADDSRDTTKAGNEEKGGNV